MRRARKRRPHVCVKWSIRMLLLVKCRLGRGIYPPTHNQGPYEMSLFVVRFNTPHIPPTHNREPYDTHY